MDLKKIGEKMAHQDHRMTQYVLFVVLEDEKVPSLPGNGQWERKDGEIDFSLLCDLCGKLHEDGEDLPIYCDDCEPDCFWECETIEKFNLKAGVFLTSEACDDHIKVNHYHYNNPRSYGISAWRNYEMQAVMKHLIKDHAGLELPNHYR